MLSIKSIKWMKNVSNHENNGAYLSVNDVFNLHFPNHHKGNVLSPKCDEIILIFQKIDKDIKFTHLVSPIDNQLYEDKNNSNYKYFRKVKILAKCLNRPFISRKDSILRDLNFKGISQGNAIEIKNIKQVKEEQLLESIQMDLYSIFYSFGIDDNIDNPNLPEENDINDSEGRRKLISHYAYERSGMLIKTKKSIALQNNNIRCEVCDFDFSKIYGEQYIECHHNIPMNTNYVRNTRLEELSLVCSNCHRMLHRKINDRYLSCNELKEIRIRNLTTAST
jgi:5-methylcytosine-specific restriction enzyme A